jgi:predicted ATPase with chaperone activity
MSASSLHAIGRPGDYDLAEPAIPESVQETGLGAQFLLNFLLKAIYLFGVETIGEAEEELKLTRGVLSELLVRAREKRLVEVLGLIDSRSSDYRYALTPEGRKWALEALEQSQYVGPAPVALDEYQAQVVRQSVSNERVDPAMLSDAVSHLVLPDETVARLGPALNSGKAILLYGEPGNGKTATAVALSRCFHQTILVPYCIVSDGQIVKMFDPAVHEPCEEPSGESASHDRRWVRCRRPSVLTGGELTLEMLDLSVDPVTRICEAPAHIKATGGIFIIDDFGRQRVAPRDLMNRWLLPLERGIDYLTMPTGKKLKMPFDQVVVLSTNTPPLELMDRAALRRIDYKVHISVPSPVDYLNILERVCRDNDLDLPGPVAEHILARYQQAGVPHSGSDPRFLVEHVIARSNFEHVPTQLTKEFVDDAFQNLLIAEPTTPTP